MALQTKDPSTAVISSVGTAVSGGTTSDTKPVITGKADAGNIVVVYDGVRPIGSVIADANGNWTITPALDLKTGAHNFAAIAHDTAGNFGASSALVNVTITSSAVTPPTPIITDDHGLPIVAGGTTADAKPQISGSGPAGDIITVYDGATPIGSTKINPDGKWTFTPTTDLSNATHAITVTDKVPGGTEGPHSGAAGFTVDTTVPSSPTVTSATNWNGDDRIGDVPVGAVVASPDVVIFGKALAGAVVYVYDGATLVGSSVAAANGTWNFENKAFAQGSHDITATVKNAAGTESAHSNHWTFSVDTSTPAKPAAPTVTDDSGATIVPGGTTNDAQPHIDGKGTPGDIIKVLDNDKVIGSTTVKPDGNWSFTPTTDLNNGPHDITVIDTNPAGTSSPASDPTHITVDTSVPDKPATPVLTDASDAVIPAGSTTNDGHPHISGTGKAGDTITVYDGTKAIGSTTVQPDGKWTFTPATDLSTGAHSISVTETNAAGTPSPKSDAVPFTYAVVAGAPVIESVVDAVGTITGPIVNGGVTDDSHPTISGTGVVGYTVYVFQNGTGCGQATVDSTGHWTLKLTGALSDGQHVMTATQFTGSGAQSVASNAWTITVDTSPVAAPPVPVLTDEGGTLIPAGSTTADAHPYISGKGTAGDIITVYDGATPLGSVKIGADGNWTFKPTTDLSNTGHSITVTDTNAAGTTSPHSGAVDFTVNTTPGPSITITGVYDYNHTLIPNHGSNTGTFTVEGTATGYANGDTVSLWFTGATAVGDTNYIRPQIFDIQIVNGKFSVVLTLDTKTGVGGTGYALFSGNPGDIAISGWLQDSAHKNRGSSNVYTITETNWTTAGAPATPAVPVLTDDNGSVIPAGSTTADGHPNISGKGTAGDVITVYDKGAIIGSTTVAANGTWTFKPAADLATGAHSITVAESNSAGMSPQSGSIPFTFAPVTIPATPATPVLTDDNGSVIPAGSTTADAQPHISGSGTAGDIIKVYDNGSIIGSTTIGPDGKWSFTPTTDLSKGGHDITVTDTNAAGTSGASNPAHINVDTSVPAAPPVPVLTDEGGALIPAGSTTADAHPYISGKGTAGDIITVYDGATPLGSVKIGTDGNWTFKPTTDLSIAGHSITVTDTNAAGTTGPHSGAVDFTVASAPAAPSIDFLRDFDSSGNLVGTVPAGSTIAYHTVQIFGSGLANAVVYIYDGATLIGSSQVSASGNWNYPKSDYSNGAHDLSATVKSAGGVESAHSNHIPFTVNSGTVPATPATPVLTDESGAAIPAGSTTTDAHPHISGTGTAGDIITVYDGANVIGSVKIGPDGKWTFTPTTDLSNAGHSITVTDTNAAGTSPHSGAVDFTVNTTPGPSVTITGVYDHNHALISDHGSNTGTFTVEGTATGYANGDIVSLYFGGSALGDINSMRPQIYNVQIVNGKFSVVLTADTKTGVTGTGNALFSGNAGDITMTALLQDSAYSNKATGNTYTINETSWTSADAPATPAVPVLTDDNGTVIPAGSTTTDGHPFISGKGTAGDIVTVYDKGSVIGSTTVGSDGNWKFKPATDLATGAHSITAAESNSAGTSAQSGSIGFTYGNVPAKPAIPVMTDDGGSVIPAGSATIDGHPHVSGTGTAGDIMKLYDQASGSLLGSAVVDGSGHWTITPSSNVSAGGHYLYVTDTNAFGTSPHSDTWLLNYVPASPLLAPMISGLIDHTAVNTMVANGGSTYDSSPTIKGTLSNGLSNGQTVEVFRDGQAIGVATVSGTGWSYTDSAVSKGQHTYTAQVQSSAGNSPMSSTFTFTETTNALISDGMGAVFIQQNINYTNSQVDGFKIMLWPKEGGSSMLTYDATAPGSGYTWMYYSMRAYTKAGVFVSTIVDTVRSNDGTGPYWTATVPVVTFTQGSINPDLVYVLTAKSGESGREFIIDAHTGAEYLNPASVQNSQSGWYNSVDEVPAGLYGTGNVKATLVSATHDVAVADDSTQVVAATDHSTVDANGVHHTAVDTDGTFHGTAANGNETVDLNVDPTDYFKQATAHIEGSKGAAIDTLHLTGDHQVLDLTSLTGQTAAAKVSGIEVVDLGGAHNTLKLSLVDVLNLGETDLFQQDGKQQMMVKGAEGDTVDLSNSHIVGLAEGEWQQHGTTQVGGVTYNVYEHSGVHTELLVQQGVQIVVH
jgi:hypothetical protein